MPLPTVETRQMDAFATLALHIQKSPYTDDRDLALPRPERSNRDCVRAQTNVSFPHERRRLKVSFVTEITLNKSGTCSSAYR